MADKLTMKEAVTRAVAESDACLAGLVSDGLRFKFGFNAEAVYAFAERHTGIERPAWERLMLESEEDC